jgi:hypothetical protein
VSAHRRSLVVLLGLLTTLGLLAGGSFRPAAAWCGGAKCWADIDCVKCRYSILNAVCDAPDCNTCFDQGCYAPPLGGASSSLLQPRGLPSREGAQPFTAACAAAPEPPRRSSWGKVLVVTLKSRT